MRTIIIIGIILIIIFWAVSVLYYVVLKDKDLDQVNNKFCELNSDCVVFGKDGDCNCGCYNKDFLPPNSGGACFCAAPTSCECINNQCEGVFEETEINPCIELGCETGSIYVGSINSDKYYECRCGWAKTISLGNIICFATDAEALADNRTKSEC